MKYPNWGTGNVECQLNNLRKYIKNNMMRLGNYYCGTLRRKYFMKFIPDFGDIF